MNISKVRNALSNTKGRFVNLNVKRVASGVTSYSAKIQSVTDKTVLFWDSRTRKSMRVPLQNVVI